MLYGYGLYGADLSGLVDYSQVIEDATIPPRYEDMFLGSDLRAALDDIAQDDLEPAAPRKLAECPSRELGMPWRIPEPSKEFFEDPCTTPSDTSTACSASDPFHIENDNTIMSPKHLH